MNIEIFKTNQKIQGFNFQEGFVALLNENRNITAATSGWVCSGEMFVYRPQPGGGWTGNWESQETFPIDEVMEKIHSFKEQQELAKALAEAEGAELHVSASDIVFTDTVPGEDCNNGGEYGFYTRYSPIKDYPGIYRIVTETTCDFDACGTDGQGIKALTEKEYRKLKQASDKVEAEGCLY